ncbi:AAA family ATPase [Paenibacillus sp. QZ-Y1]|uniref:AAA family ATPase n=1 Tax=Paenibacillus sp. QZ-Y1 TaxID=3414511 RepID=UPI003F7A9D11
MSRSVYIISGPAGVGKSTTSKRLVEHLDRSSYISGDDISHLPVNGSGKPWLCQETHQLTWINILSLAKNLIEFNYDVIIDYVTFPSEANWLANELESMNVKVIYVVFMVDHETIIVRDQSRDPMIQMGDRSVILLNEFKEVLKDERHVLNTQEYSVDQIDEVIEEIVNNNRFLIR